jgi:hypothetical protein
VMHAAYHHAKTKLGGAWAWRVYKIMKTFLAMKSLIELHRAVSGSLDRRQTLYLNDLYTVLIFGSTVGVIVWVLGFKNTHIADVPTT